MPEAGRVGDIAWVPADSHGNSCCAHSAQGPAVAGSPNILINGKQALRVGDPGIHSFCCGSNSWRAEQGAPGVFFNDIPAHRVRDATTHCGGGGVLINGSANVIIGDYGGGAGPSPTGSYQSNLPPGFEGGFIVYFEGTDIPVVNRSYRIVRGDGSILEAKTNALGRTMVMESDHAETLRIQIEEWESVNDE